MSRKKATGKKNKRMSSSKVEVMEKSFKEMPAHLATQYKKDIAALKQQESTLKTNLKRTTSQKKSNPTLTKTLTVRLNEIQKQIQKTTEGSRRIMALNKAIAKFNAEWKGQNRKPAMQAKKSPARPVMNKPVKKVMPVIQEHTLSQDGPVNASTEVSELSSI